MQRLSSRVAVFTSRAAAAMTSGAVISAGEALLIDPGILPDEVEAIDRFVASEAVVTTLLLTHHHWDHILATQRWPAARRVAHPTFEAALARVEEPPESSARRVFAEHGFDPPASLALLPVTDHLDDGAILAVGDLRAELVHLPGHAGDALGLWLPDERVLFSSDMLDSLELPMPDQDIDLHLASLARIEGMVAAGAVDTVVPGHGPVLRGFAAIRAQIKSDRAYLLALRAVAEQAAARGEAFEEAWPRFAAIIYPDKGNPERDHEHRTNARLALERLRSARESVPPP